MPSMGLGYRGVEGETRNNGGSLTQVVGLCSRALGGVRTEGEVLLQRINTACAPKGRPAGGGAAAADGPLEASEASRQSRTSKQDVEAESTASTYGFDSESEVLFGQQATWEAEMPQAAKSEGSSIASWPSEADSTEAAEDWSSERSATLEADFQLAPLGLSALRRSAPSPGAQLAGRGARS